LKRVCVFAGSSPGAREEYRRLACDLGLALVQRGLSLVYGGAKVGLMGILADTALRHGGEVIGIIPEALVTKEVAHSELSELRIVPSMHERKRQMAELSDAFVALPGGIGTVEEFTEILTWAQLGLHVKPCGLLNAGGFYDRLIDFLDHAVSERFLRPDHRSMLLIAQRPEDLLDLFAGYSPPAVEKWIDRPDT
jgi:uncharacterized protein (TIGR00730 family)